MFLIPAEEISGVSTTPAVCSILPLLGPTTGSDVAAAAEEQLRALCMGHKAEAKQGKRALSNSMATSLTLHCIKASVSLVCMCSYQFSGCHHIFALWVA